MARPSVIVTFWLQKSLRTLKGWYFDGYCDIWALDIFQILNVKCSRGPLSVTPAYWSYIANCQDFILISTFHTGKPSSLKLLGKFANLLQSIKFKRATHCIWYCQWSSRQGCTVYWLKSFAFRFGNCAVLYKWWIKSLPGAVKSCHSKSHGL